MYDACFGACSAGSGRLLRSFPMTPRVQVPNYHILSKIVTYITAIENPST